MFLKWKGCSNDKKTDSTIVGKIRKEERSWNKSSLIGSKTFKHFHTFDEAEKKRWKNNNDSSSNVATSSSSTLSLHIAAYENSVIEDGNTVSFINSKDLNMKGKSSGLIKKWKTAIIGSTTLVTQVIFIEA